MKCIQNYLIPLNYCYAYALPTTCTHQNRCMFKFTWPYTDIYFLSKCKDNLFVIYSQPQKNRKPSVIHLSKLCKFILPNNLFEWNSWDLNANFFPLVLAEEKFCIYLMKIRYMKMWRKSINVIQNITIFKKKKKKPNFQPLIISYVSTQLQIASEGHG